MKYSFVVFVSIFSFVTVYSQSLEVGDIVRIQYGSTICSGLLVVSSTKDSCIEVYTNEGPRYYEKRWAFAWMEKTSGRPAISLERARTLSGFSVGDTVTKNIFYQRSFPRPEDRTSYKILSLNNELAVLQPIKGGKSVTVERSWLWRTVITIKPGDVLTSYMSLAEALEFAKNNRLPTHKNEQGIDIVTINPGDQIDLYSMRYISLMTIERNK